MCFGCEVHMLEDCVCYFLGKKDKGKVQYNKPNIINKQTTECWCTLIVRNYMTKNVKNKLAMANKQSYLLNQGWLPRMIMNINIPKILKEKSLWTIIVDSMNRLNLA